MINDDPRLNALIKQGKHGDIVIIGAPYDYARKRSYGKGGQDNGPCCLRRFFPKVGPLTNPEFGISIANLNVTDYGNVDFKASQESTAPQKAISRIRDEIFQIIKNKQLPIVLGGSKETTYGSSLAFAQLYPDHHHILIAGKPTLKRAYDENKLAADNLITLLKHNEQHSLTLFGTSMRYFPNNYNKNFQIISYEQIRKSPVKKGEYVNTQGGTVLLELIQQLKGKKVQVSLSVEAIERFRGCRDVLALGLTVQEIIQMFLLMGKSSEVLLVDISEFNPSVQDYESSLVIVNLIYYFLMGWSLRAKITG